MIFWGLYLGLTEREEEERGHMLVVVAMDVLLSESFVSFARRTEKKKVTIKREGEAQ